MYIEKLCIDARVKWLDYAKLLNKVCDYSQLEMLPAHKSLSRFDFCGSTVLSASRARQVSFYTTVHGGERRRSKQALPKTQRSVLVLLFFWPCAENNCWNRNEEWVKGTKNKPFTPRVLMFFCIPATIEG